MNTFSRISAVTLAAALLSAGIGSPAGPSRTLAQSRPSSPTTVPQAPVGHRQPTASEAAQPVLNDPSGGTAKQKAETERARRITRSICSNC